MKTIGSILFAVSIFAVATPASAGLLGTKSGANQSRNYAGAGSRAHSNNYGHSNYQTKFGNKVHESGHMTYERQSQLIRQGASNFSFSIK